MRKTLWIIVAVIITVIVFAATLAWGIFVSLLMVGLRIVPFVLVVLLVLYFLRKKDAKKK